MHSLSKRTARKRRCGATRKRSRAKRTLREHGPRRAPGVNVYDNRALNRFQRRGKIHSSQLSTKYSKRRPARQAVVKSAPPWTKRACFGWATPLVNPATSHSIPSLQGLEVHVLNTPRRVQTFPRGKNSQDEAPQRTASVSPAFMSRLEGGDTLLTSSYPAIGGENTY